jgi:hypothetical protein
MDNIVRLRVFENRVLRKTFGPKRKELPGGGWEGGEDCIMRICMICTAQKM